MDYYYLFLMALMIPISIFTLIAGIGGAPSVPCPKKIARKMVEAADIEKGRIYFDLGSGDGRILREISQKGGQAIGFEYAPLTYLISKLFLLFGKDNNAKIHWKNFYKEDLSRAKGIFCFLSPNAMNRLSFKFEKELEKGTKVISYVFKIPNKKITETIKIENVGPIYVYNY